MHLQVQPGKPYFNYVYSAPTLAVGHAMLARVRAPLTCSTFLYCACQWRGVLACRQRAQLRHASRVRREHDARELRDRGSHVRVSAHLRLPCAWPPAPQAIAKLGSVSRAKAAARDMCKSRAARFQGRSNHIL